MIVHQTDDQGRYIFSVEADPDPEVEGGWLIPAGCVTVAPPQVSEGAHAVWQGGAWIIVTPPPPPPPPTAEQVLAEWRAGASLTDIQFALACATLGYMTFAETEAWVGRGEIPQVALDAIALIPDQLARSAARVRFAGARTIARLDPFIPLLMAACTPDLTDAQVDEIFTVGAAL